MQQYGWTLTRSPHRRWKISLAAPQYRSRRAVCILMTNSNLVDCTPGKSAGALKDAAGIDADLTIPVRRISSATHQPVGATNSRYQAVQKSEFSKMAPAW